ncbi:MAG: transcriptional regulator [Thermoanaerobaculia bacterium]|nr:transcriptional regulator [Thermoanaerobaculia bacterium]
MARQPISKKPQESVSSGQPRRERLEGMASYLADPNAKEFDRLVYERVRLGILSALSVSRRMSFSELKQLLQTSDGNLSVHARKLEDADYIACTKTFEGRLPRTEYELTEKGRHALERYLDHMEALIDATREG